MAARISTRLLLATAKRSPRVSSQPACLTRAIHPGWRPEVRSHTLRQKPQQIRWHSALPSYSKIYKFDDIKALSENPSKDRTLIDVREPTEFASGSIPTAINIPISSQPDALMVANEEFEDRFGFDKPEKDKEVVFFCKAGVRSSAAANLASQSGYEKIGEYRGSWLDWTANGGKVEKDS